jgi:hypothetical protein
MVIQKYSSAIPYFPEISPDKSFYKNSENEITKKLFLSNALFIKFP